MKIASNIFGPVDDNEWRIIPKLTAIEKIATKEA